MSFEIIFKALFDSARRVILQLLKHRRMAMVDQSIF